MAINTGKVVVGGLAAGVVANVIDFVANGVVLADQNEAAMAAINPMLAENMMGGSTIAGLVVVDFVFGLILVFTYAAMRPRFGPGMKTAMIAGLTIWLTAGAMYSLFVISGMFTWGYFALGAVVALVNTLASAAVGAFLYKEDGGGAAPAM